jgi:hypothetical protein
LLDDFYDRTKINKKTTKQATTSISAEPICSLDSLVTPALVTSEIKKCEIKRDQLRLQLKELVLTSTTSSVDSLDSYMSSITEDVNAQKKSSIKFELRQLQTRYLQLQSLLKQRVGEQAVKQYQQGNTQVFQANSNSNSHSASNSSIGVSSSNASNTCITCSSLSNCECPSIPTSTSISSSSSISISDALSHAKKKKFQLEREQQIEQLKREVAEEQERIRIAQEPVRIPSIPISTAPIDRYAELAQQLEAQRTKRTHTDDDEVSKLLKRTQSHDPNLTSHAHELPSDEIAQGGLHLRKKTKLSIPPSSSTNNVHPTSNMSTSSDSFDEPSDSVWLPPSNQSGDGRTKLNEKFGY